MCPPESDVVVVDSGADRADTKIASSEVPESSFDCSEGDFDETLLALVDENITKMVGTWSLDSSRSESADALMAALGVGMMKRKVMKTAKTGVRVEAPCVDQVTGRLGINMVSLLPMGIKKEGVVFIDGNPFEHKDSDTGIWSVVAEVRNGRLVQRRESSRGVMYDCRATLTRDMKGEKGTFHVFKWTFISKDGKKYVAHRWFQCA